MDRPEPTGAVRNGPAGPEILISRNIDRPIEDVWAFLTDSALLGGWYGTWSGDLAEGVVQLAMVEAPDAAEKCRINRCERPRILDLTMGNDEDGAWNLKIELGEAGDKTHLMLRQPLGTMAAESGDIGPGWEYYLDRLTAALYGRHVDDIEFSWYYPHQAAHYRTVAEEE